MHLENIVLPLPSLLLFVCNVLRVLRHVARKELHCTICRKFKRCTKHVLHAHIMCMDLQNSKIICTRWCASYKKLRFAWHHALKTWGGGYYQSKFGFLETAQYTAFFPLASLHCAGAADNKTLQCVLKCISLLSTNKPRNHHGMHMDNGKTWVNAQ